MDFIPFEQVTLTDGFWRERQRINAETTLDTIYVRFVETGRFAGLNCDGKTLPHIFYDSDVAKWIEAVSYALARKRDARLEGLVDDAVDKMIAHQRDDGYFNMHFLVTDTDKIFTMRTEHELYCAGHYIESAIAYAKATGKRRYLDMVLWYVDCIEKAFIVERTATFVTPGHEEIELALVKLFEYTGDRRYLNMARFFLDNRGLRDEEEYSGVNHLYSQSHLPVREQRTAEGHSVRAGYLYSAMADLAYHDCDAALKTACEEIFDNIINRRMYITGGVGSTERGEAFTVDYDLPNLTAYAESCAAISLMMFAHRMTRMDADARYADVVERVMYNGFLSSVSLDGKSFFYVNPLEILPRLIGRDASMKEKERRRLPITQRREVFDCSCCPPNIARYMASLSQFFFTRDDDTLYIHQYANCQAEIGGARVTQSTAYPRDGRVTVLLENCAYRRIALRKPAWCERYAVKINGEDVCVSPVKGYLYLSAARDMTIEAEFDMPVFLVQSNPLVHENSGRVAVQRGPLVYCAEAVDNGENVRDISLPDDLNASLAFDKSLQCDALHVDGWRSAPCDALYRAYRAPSERVRVRLIPYFAFANRGESEMIVWLGKA